MKWRLSLPKWFDSGLGNYYAYAADSRLMDSLDAFIYQEVWKYCLHKSGGRQNQPTAGTHAASSPSEIGYYQVGLVLEQVIDYHGLVAFLVNP